MIIQEHFDDLFVTEGRYQPPVFKQNRMIIQVENIGLMKTHPLNDTGQLKFLPKCNLIFNNVVRSERIIDEYEIDRFTIGQNEKSNPKKIEDGPFTGASPASVTEYGLEGVLMKPEAWIQDWVIEADSFELEVPDEFFRVS